MGVLLNSGTLPPAFGSPPEERDRFGLPMIWSLLDDDQQFNERITKTKVFVADAVEAVIRQVGREEARRMFLKVLKRPSPGSQPNKRENARRLEMYDRQIALRIQPRRAAGAAAEDLATGPNDDVESIAKHIRTLVKERAKAARRAEEEAQRLKKLSPLLIDEIERERKTDLE
jgi:hypothetical protein